MLPPALAEVYPTGEFLSQTGGAISRSGDLKRWCSISSLTHLNSRDISLYPGTYNKVMLFIFFYHFFENFSLLKNYPLTCTSIVLRNLYRSPGKSCVEGLYSLRYFMAKKLGVPG